ncbi:MAG: hypothetical protein WCT02_03420 [Candidatus Paceibacterota bacterium]
MNIITVIPLSRSKVAEELSYFSGVEMPVGAVVTVPLRSKSIQAVVTKVQPVSELKSDIKDAPFAIRKLSKVDAEAFLPPIFIEVCQDLAKFYATTVGAVMDGLISDSILKNAGKIAAPLPRQNSFEVAGFENKRSGVGNILAVQGDDDDRLSSWRSLIRQEFARKRSVAVYIPTIEDGTQIFKALEKGIEGYIFQLNSSLTDKKLLSEWKKMSETEHSVVVVATSSFCLLPRGDIETVIVERENSRGWIGQKSPYLDLRQAIEMIASRRGQSVYLGDSLLRLATLERVEKGELDQASPFKWRSVSTARDYLIDLRSKEKASGPVVPKPKNISAAQIENAVIEDDASDSVSDLSNNTTKIDSNNSINCASDNDNLDPDVAEIKEFSAGQPRQDKILIDNFQILSKELEELIERNIQENTHLFLLALRRGHSPITVCDDCQTVVACNNCQTPVVLYLSKESSRNFFMCRVCGERRSADEYCKACGGWRLKPLGIGIDRVRQALAAKFPELEVFQIDADITKNEKEIAEALNNFSSRPGSVLLGTEMAFSRLVNKVDHVVVVSLDSLFSLPDFLIQEKVMYLLIRLRALATRSILVQTRRPEEKVFEYGLKGNLSDFYRTTLDDRKTFLYPPFSVLVKISIEGKKDQVAAQMAEVAKIVDPREMDIFPAFTSTSRGQSVIHGLIKIPASAWPDNDLVNKLRSLPPGVMVKINPESLL